MANISKVKLPDNTTYDVISKQTRSVIFCRPEVTSTASAFKVNVPSILSLYNGLILYIYNNVVTSEANATLELNNFGAKRIRINGGADDVGNYWRKDRAYLFVFDSATDRWVMNYTDIDTVGLTIDMIYPVGSIYMSVNNVNPGTYLTGTTWEAWGAGRVPVGVDTSQNVFDTVEKTGGETAHLLTSAESGVPSHAHTYTSPTVASSGYVANGITGGSHDHTLANGYGWTWGDSAATESAQASVQSEYWGNNAITTNRNKNSNKVQSNTHTHNLPNHTHTLTGGGVADNTAENASQAHNNLQPYITCYMWKRTT